MDGDGVVAQLAQLCIPAWSERGHRGRVDQDRGVPGGAQAVVGETDRAPQEGFGIGAAQQLLVQRGDSSVM